MFLLSCNRKPEACLEMSSSSVNMGESISFTDCSTHSFSNELLLGDGAKFNDIKSKSHSYYNAGAYQIELKVFSKKGNKSASVIEKVKVSAPPFSKIKGQWKLTTVETYDQLEIDPNIDLFDYPLVKTEIFEELLTIEENKMLITHISEAYFIFENDLPIKFLNTGIIQTEKTSFKIVRFDESSMIWTAPYFKGFKLVYLSRL